MDTQGPRLSCLCIVITSKKNLGEVVRPSIKKDDLIDEVRSLSSSSTAR